MPLPEAKANRPRTSLSKRYHYRSRDSIAGGRDRHAKMKHICGAVGNVPAALAYYRLRCQNYRA